MSELRQQTHGEIDVHVQLQRRRRRDDRFLLRPCVSDKLTSAQAAREKDMKRVSTDRRDALFLWMAQGGSGIGVFDLCCYDAQASCERKEFAVELRALRKGYAAWKAALPGKDIAAEVGGVPRRVGECGPPASCWPLAAWKAAAPGEDLSPKSFMIPRGRADILRSRKT